MIIYMMIIIFNILYEKNQEVFNWRRYNFEIKVLTNLQSILASGFNKNNKEPLELLEKLESRYERFLYAALPNKRGNYYNEDY